MLKVSDYLMGHDLTHGLDLSTQIRANAARTVEIVNKLLVLAKTAGVSLEQHPRTGTVLSSGWRPPAVNASTPGAAPRSKHLLGLAADIYDPDGDLDEWCLANKDTVLKDLGLWLEHPAATKTWCHVQTVPPGSKRRVFFP
jgi:hypothetical protein